VERAYREHYISRWNLRDGERRLDFEEFKDLAVELKIKTGCNWFLKGRMTEIGLQVLIHASYTPLALC